MGHEMELTDTNFDQEVLKSSTPVLVDFWAEWCGPCKMIMPAVNEIAAEYAGRVKVAKVNVDNSSEVAARYYVRSIPSLLIFKNGKLLDQIVGAVAKGEITSRLDAALLA